MSKEKERFDYLDRVKGFAIIFIVIQHAISNQSYLYDINNLYLLKFITQFTMPTFFVVNGFLYSKKYSDNPIEGTIKKVKAYYLPFVAYNMFFLIFHNLFVFFNFENEFYGNSYYDIKTFIKHVAYVLMCKRELFSGALWFLGSILTISVVFMFSDWIGLKLAGGKYRYVVLTCVVIIMAFAGITELAPQAMKLQRSCTDIVFFYVGFLWRQFRINEKCKDRRLIIFLFSLVVLILGAYFFSIGISKSGFEYVLYYSLGLIGALMMFQFCQLSIFDKSKVISYIGRSSMEIMALQFFVFKIVSIIIVQVYALPKSALAEYPVVMGMDGAWWIAYSIVGVVVPVLFKYMKDVVKNKIILMKM